jgi:hypothetical protein
MQIIFLDESGYSPDWKKQIDEQPFYVLSAVCIPTSNIPAAYERLRKEIDRMSLPGQKKPLGRGFEIKARDVAQGIGWWNLLTESLHKKGDKVLGIGLKEFP